MEGDKYYQICKTLFDDNILFTFPYKRPVTKKGYSKNIIMVIIDIIIFIFVRMIKIII